MWCKSCKLVQQSLHKMSETILFIQHNTIYFPSHASVFFCVLSNSRPSPCLPSLFFPHLFKPTYIPLLSVAYWKANNVHEKQRETVCFIHTIPFFSPNVFFRLINHMLYAFHCQFLWTIFFVGERLALEIATILEYWLWKLPNSLTCPIRIIVIGIGQSIHFKNPSIAGSFDWLVDSREFNDRKRETEECEQSFSYSLHCTNRMNRFDVVGASHN